MILSGKVRRLILPVIAVWQFFQTAAALRAEDENLTTGTAPPALVMDPPQTTAPGLVRWLGDPLSHTARAIEGSWTNDGSRLYLFAGLGRRREVWQGKSGGSELRLIGYLQTLSKIAASGDGRWIAGHGTLHKDEKGALPSLALFHADTLQGVWEIRDKEFLNVEQLMFSQDGKYLIAGTQTNGGYSISIFDVATGHRVKHIERLWPEDASNVEPNVRPGPGRMPTPRLAPGRICYYAGTDSLMLSSVFDDQFRLTRVSLKTFETTPMGEPVPEDWRHAGFLSSSDGHWVAYVRDNDYSVHEWKGEKYAESFSGHVSDEPSEKAAFDDQDSCIYFSPDETCFIISGPARYKVIRLKSKKVVHESDTESLVGFYTPDGRTFWQTAPQFRALDTSTWEPRPDAAPWARHDAEMLHFSPKGHLVLFGNAYSAEVWDIEGKQPLVELAPLKSPILGSFLWSASGQEIYGSELSQFLRWKMPATFTQGKTERIVGEPLFELPAKLLNKKPVVGWNSFGRKWRSTPVIVAVDEATDTCLTVVNPFKTYADFRYPDRPSVVHHMILENQNPCPFEHAFFGMGGKELYYSSNVTLTTTQEGVSWQVDQRMRLFGYEMETDHLRESNGGLGTLVGYDKARGHLVTLSRDTGINVIDAATANTLKKLFMPTRAYWSLPATVSPDGRWIFCMVHEDWSELGGGKIALVDLEKGSLAALIPAPDSAVRSGAFSADNTYLAVGHENGCVSIWNVAAMTATAPRGIKLMDAVTRRGRLVGDGPAPIHPKMGVVPPIKLKQGGTWLIDEKGALVLDQADVRIGDWFVNGLSSHAHGQQVSRFDAPESIYVDVSTELRDISGNLRVQRHAHVDTLGQISFVDEWENLSDEAQDPRVAFVSTLGVDLTSMLSEDGSPPHFQGRQAVFGGGENHLAVLLPPSGGQPEQALGICFGGLSAPQPAALHWDQRQRTLVSEWTLHLAPFQRRVICHEVLQHPGQDPQSLPAIFTEYHTHGFETHVPESVVDHVVNFAVDPQYRSAFEKLNLSKGLEADGTRKDGHGIHWRHTESMDNAESELGVERILSLWLNRQPLSFSRPATDGVQSGEPPSDSIEEFSSPDTPLQVRRRTFFSPAEGCLVTHDTFVNNTDKPVAMPADYLIVARSKIDSVIGADGNKLELTEPFPIKKCGGRLAVVFEGETQPALVLAAGDPQAALLPVLLYFPDFALFLHYDIKLNPGERVSIANLAAARPLSALNKPADAFAGLKAPMDFPRFQMNGIAAPANWQASGK